MSSPPVNPSPFYGLLQDAQPYRLRFPTNHQEMAGPYWDATGQLLCTDEDDWWDERVLAVALGSDRYRLAEKCDGPFSGLRLHWGDEFLATATGDTALRLTGVVMPQRYRHYRFMAGAGEALQQRLSDLVHPFAGGWEIVAGGMVTLTVPCENAEAFEREAAKVPELAGGLPLVD